MTVSSKSEIRPMNGLNYLAEIDKDSEQQLSVVEQFIHHVIDDLCGRTPDYGKLSASLLKAPKVNVHALAKEIKAFVATSVSKESSEVTRSLAQYSYLSKDLCGILSSAIESRAGEVCVALGESTTAMSEAQLTDFDWSLRMIISSDRLSKMRQPVLLLTTYINNADGEPKQIVMELTKEKLRQVLIEFSSISEALQSLSE